MTEADTRAAVEPMAGITDALTWAEQFIGWARAHRDRPERDDYRAFLMDTRHSLIAKLHALGKQE